MFINDLELGGCIHIVVGWTACGFQILYSLYPRSTNDERLILAGPQFSVFLTNGFSEIGRENQRRD